MAEPPTTGNASVDNASASLSAAPDAAGGDQMDADDFGLWYGSPSSKMWRISTSRASGSGPSMGQHQGDHDRIPEADPRENPVTADFVRPSDIRRRGRLSRRRNNTEQASSSGHRMGQHQGDHGGIPQASDPGPSMGQHQGDHGGISEASDPGPSMGQHQGDHGGISEASDLGPSMGQHQGDHGGIPEASDPGPSMGQHQGDHGGISEASGSGPDMEGDDHANWNWNVAPCQHPLGHPFEDDNVPRVAIPFSVDQFREMAKVRRLTIHEMSAFFSLPWTIDDCQHEPLVRPHKNELYLFQPISGWKEWSYDQCVWKYLSRTRLEDRSLAIEEMSGCLTVSGQPIPGTGKLTKTVMHKLGRNNRKMHAIQYFSQDWIDNETGETSAQVPSEDGSGHMRRRMTVLVGELMGHLRRSHPPPPVP